MPILDEPPANRLLSTSEKHSTRALPLSAGDELLLGPDACDLRAPHIGELLRQPFAQHALSDADGEGVSTLETANGHVSQLGTKGVQPAENLQTFGLSQYVVGARKMAERFAEQLFRLIETAEVDKCMRLILDGEEYEVERIETARNLCRLTSENDGARRVTTVAGGGRGVDERDRNAQLVAGFAKRHDRLGEQLGGGGKVLPPGGDGTPVLQEDAPHARRPRVGQRHQREILSQCKVSAQLVDANLHIQRL